MEFYLKEAFQSLKLLEDDFNLTADQGVIDELQSFVADDIEAPAEEEIIDVEADEVEDLQDNYIGKVILECDSCHTRIYKDIADVIIDEDSGLANVDEECPVCGNAFGWNVLGKIEKFNPDEFEEEEHEDEEEPDEDADEAEETEEISDDEISEALREALSADEQKELDGIVYNHLADAAYEAEVDHELDAQRSDMEKAQKKFNDDFYFGTVEEDIDVHVDQPEDSDDVVINVDADDELHEEFEDPDKVGVDPDRAVEDDHDLETPMENPVTEIPDKLVVNESKLTEDVWHVRELVYGWLYDHLLDLNDNLAQQLHYEIPEYDVDWCSEDGMGDMSYKVEEDMDEYVNSLINLLFANAPRQESLGEDLDEAPVDPELKAGKPEKVGKWEYSVDKNALDKAMDTIYNKLSEEEFELLNDNALNAYIDKDPEALEVVKKIFKKYGLPMWALKAFAESWDDQNLEEDLENVQSEDAKKLEDPEKDPIKGELEEECDKEESLNEKAIDPALKGQKPKKVDKFEYSMSNDAVKRVADIIYNEMEESDFDLLNDIGFNAYIDKDPEAIKQVKELFKKYGLPMWALKVFCEAWDDQNESLNEKFSASLAGEHKGSLEDKFGEGCKDEYYESLNEDLNEVEVHTDDQDIEVKTEDGKVVVEVGNPEPAETPSEDEMIAPLDAEEITDIENNEEQSAEEVAMEDEASEEDTPAEEDELDVDEFDEESFDEIGESYLHRVYENVNSFKTTSVKKGSNKLVVEGLIRFNSGKEKKTSFVFENARTTKRGKLMLEGKNETFSRSSKAFLLKGVLANKKFIAESMTYNYTAKTINESNESELTRVYGRAVRK